MKPKFKAEYTKEAIEQLKVLSREYRNKIVSAIGIFEEVGTDYKNINDLRNGLFEIKPSGVRAYFAYHPKQNKIIIVGFICLKKTQQAPPRYIKQAQKNIENYLKERSI